MPENKVKFDPEKTVFLIDGSSFLYRAYYGVKPMHTSKGEPVHAVYTFCRMIRKLMSKFEAKYISIVWDSKGKTTRHEMFENYKATRQAPPSDLFIQKDRIFEITDAIGMQKVAQAGIEADDILYTLGQEYVKQGLNVIVVTLDKDMGQMLQDNIYLYDAFKEIITDQKDFETKMGCSVQKLPFYFSLLGDTSDNIPGVKGIGEKGALELVNQFDSLDSLYENLDKVIRAKAKNALETNKENAFLSYKLFLLQYIPEIAAQAQKESILFDSKNWSKAIEVFKELEFKSLIRELDQDDQMGIVAIDGVKKTIESLDKNEFICVTEIEQLNSLCFKLKNCQGFATDTETDGLDPLASNCVGISICIKEGTSYYIPFGHNWDKSEFSQLTKEEIDKHLKPILQDESIEKYLHNAKFDMLVFHNAGIELKGLAFDSLIAARLVAKAWQKNGLKNLSMQYFNEPMLEFSEVVTANKLKNFSYVLPELATKYAAADAHQTLKLTKLLKKELKQEDMQQIFDDIEFPLIQILYQMELAGITVDVAILKDLGVKVDSEIAKIETEIRELSDLQGKEINLASPKQVSFLLFEHLLLPVIKKSDKGTGYSTDQDVLTQLKKMHPVPGLILRHRELSKLKNTYIDALPGYVNKKTGKIHTSFNQTDVATGRLSSSDPNLQNIPADSSDYGLMIRQAFIPEAGNLFLSADYSQIELRVLAALSGDKNLIGAFLQERDVHTETASALFGVPFEAVTHEQRSVGKRINFSVLYGMTPFGLSKDLEISLSDAKNYIDRYFAQYPRVMDWMEEIVQDTKRNGYVQTYWGRRRYVPEIYEKNKNLYELGRRIAINTKVQGTAADIMKKGMVNLHREFEKVFGPGFCRGAGQGIGQDIGQGSSSPSQEQSFVQGQLFGVQDQILRENIILQDKIILQDNNQADRKTTHADNAGKMPQMLLQIHDELLISVPEESLDQVMGITKQVLETVVSWPVALKITMRHGKNWKEVTK